MGLYARCVAYPSNPFNILRKCGLLTSDLIPYGTFRETLREYGMMAFKVSSFLLFLLKALETSQNKVI